VTASFPNAARLIVAAMESWQDDLPPDLKFHAGGKTPKDLQAQVPFARVTRAGGPTDEIQDFPITRIEVWADTLAQAEDVAEAIRVRLVAGHLFVPGMGMLDRTDCPSLHQEIEDDDNPHLRRVITTYQHACRRLSFSA
jgi:hypothetical protein